MKVSKKLNLSRLGFVLVLLGISQAAKATVCYYDANYQYKEGEIVETTYRDPVLVPHVSSATVYVLFQNGVEIPGFYDYNIPFYNITNCNKRFLSYFPHPYSPYSPGYTLAYDAWFLGIDYVPQYSNYRYGYRYNSYRPVYQYRTTYVYRNTRVVNHRTTILNNRTTVVNNNIHVVNNNNRVINNNRVVEHNGRAPLAEPKRSQREFTPRQENAPVRSGGFGDRKKR